jgi:uncharacterized protein (DUF1015 family)
MEIYAYKSIHNVRHNALVISDCHMIYDIHHYLRSVCLVMVEWELN